MKERIAKMTDNIVSSERVAASPDDDEALSNVDQAVDTIIAAIGVIDNNLPLVKTDTVPQKAAKDVVADLMETAIKPYTADIAKALETLGG